MTRHHLQFDQPVIAHRGVRATAPENTLAAFQHAKQDGITWLETDVKLTHDGVPVLIHDELLDRTSNGRGTVADTNWNVIQNLDAGSWFNPTFAGERIPHLSQGVRYALDHHLRMNLEIKPCIGRTQATAMVTLIEASKIWEPEYPPPLISSFDMEALQISARLQPDWPRGMLLDRWHEEWPMLAKSVDATTLNINADELTKERLEHVVASGLKVLAYTVNDPQRAKELLGWGVTAVFSDDPKKILQAL